MSSENTVQRKIWLKIAKFCSVLFRINEGRAWISNLGPKGVQKLTDGSVLIKAARSVSLGFSYTNGDPVKGACDLPGWTVMTITPEMVGKKVAVFTSMEIKATTGGRVTPEQINWQQQVSNAGGIAGIVNSEEAVEQVYEDYFARMKSPILL